MQGTPVTDEITIQNSLPEEPTVTIAPANPATGDSLIARVSSTPDADGEDTVTIEGNVAPTQPTVTINPARPTDEDSIRAKVSGATDANGDRISYTYEWYGDGTLQPGRVYATVAARCGPSWRIVR